MTGVKPDHVLPVEGRKGPIPECPIALKDVGQRVWEWLWRTPQATKWHPEASLYPLARVAAEYEDLILNYTQGDAFHHASKVLEGMEDRWGLNPKAMASLHWWFGDPETEKPRVVEPVTDLRDRVKGIVS